MASTFPNAERKTLGYDVDEVERFLEDARRAYTANDTSPAIEAAKIRATAFSMKKGGYSTAHVDAALERLEDAFAAREREREIAEVGQKAWYAEARTKASDVVARLERPDGQRFHRVIQGPGFRSDAYREFGRHNERYKHAEPHQGVYPPTVHLLDLLPETQGVSPSPCKFVRYPG